MYYEFPHIRVLADFIHAVEGRDEIKVYERDGLVVVNYAVVFPDTFPHPGSAETPEQAHTYALRRESRGIIFDSQSGSILSRPYHKFHNIGEKEETQPHLIPISDSHIVLDKLDGSMVRGFVHNGTVRFGTRAGITDVSDAAHHFAQQCGIPYEQFVHRCAQQDLTPIFEWMSPKFRIVVDHRTENLVLTALRHNHTGTYVSDSIMRDEALMYDIPVVQSWDSVNDIDAFINRVRGETDNEGYVIRFHNGHMLKTKNDWYLTIHRTKDCLLFEKDVIRLILDNNLDDVIGNLPKEDQVRLSAYAEQLHSEINRVSSEITEFVNSAMNEIRASMPSDMFEDDTKAIMKRYAGEYGDRLDKMLKPIGFAVARGSSAWDLVRNLTHRLAHTQTTVDQLHTLMKLEW